MQFTNFYRKHETSCLLIALCLIYIACIIPYILFRKTWLDEGKYLMEGFWAVSGDKPLYGEEGSTNYPPVFYYLLGFFQAIFQKGHYTGRAFAALIGLASICLAFVVLAKQCRPIAAFCALLLFVTQASNLSYFASATPYSWITLLSVVGIWLIETPRCTGNLKPILLGGVYFLMYFSRANMIAALPMLWAYQVYREKPSLRWRGGLLSIAAFLILSVGLAALFPVQMIINAIELPIVTPFLRQLGVIPNTYELLRQYSYWELAQDFSFGKTLDSFWSRLLTAFPISFSLATFGIGVGFLLRKRRPLLLFSSAYFLAMAGIHTVGPQTYCPACPAVYLHYFLIFAFIAKAIALDSALDWLSNSPPDRLRTFLRAALPAAVVLFCAYRVTGPLKAQFAINRPDVAHIRQTAKKISRIIPDAKEIYVLSTSPHFVQAVFLAGKTFPKTNINPIHSYRSLRDVSSLTADQFNDLLLQMKEMSKWREEIFVEQITCRTDMLLVQPRHQHSGWIGYEKYYTPTRKLKHMAVYSRNEGIPCVDRFEKPASGDTETQAP